MTCGVVAGWWQSLQDTPRLVLIKSEAEPGPSDVKRETAFGWIKTGWDPDKLTRFILE